MISKPIERGISSALIVDRQACRRKIMLRLVASQRGAAPRTLLKMRIAVYPAGLRVAGLDVEVARPALGHRDGLRLGSRAGHRP